MSDDPALGILHNSEQQDNNENVFIYLLIAIEWESPIYSTVLRSTVLSGE